MAARQTLTMAISLEGAGKVETDLSKLGKTAEASFAKIQAAADRAGLSFDKKLGLAIVALRAKLAALGAAGARLGQSFRTFTTAVNTFGNAVAASAKRIGLVTAAIGGAIFALAKFAKSGVDQVDQADRQSQALGMNIKEFGRLQGAAQQSSISQDEFTTALNRLNVVLGKSDESAGKAATALDRLTDPTIKVHKGVEKLADGAEDGSSALAKLGLSVAGLLRLNPEQRIEAIADAFQKMADGPRKAAIATDLFGRGMSTKLIPFLNQGGAAIKALGDEAEKLGAVFTDADKATAALADNAVDKLSLAYTGLRNQISLAFAPALAEGAKAITAIIRENFAAIKSFATFIGTQAIAVVKDFFNALAGNDAAVQNKSILAFAKGVIEFGKGVKAVAIAVKNAFLSIHETIDGFVARFNKAFGTDIKTGTVEAGLALFLFAGGFRLLTTSFAIALAAGQLFVHGLELISVAIGISKLAIVGWALAFVIVETSLTNLSDQIDKMVSTPFPVGDWVVASLTATTPIAGLFWKDFTQQALDASIKIREYFKSDSFADFLDEQSANFERLWNVIKLGGSLALEAFKSTAQSVFSAIGSFVSNLISKVRDLIASFRQASSASRSAGKSGGGGGFKDGGRIRGPGTSTSDSIPIWASDGEFMMSVRAVRKYGPGFMADLNGLRLPKDGLHFNMGGLVQAMAPRFPGGGPMASSVAGGGQGRPVTVNFGGESFEMSASEQVVQKLMRAATGKQIRSNGRKPAWFGA